MWFFNIEKKIFNTLSIEDIFSDSSEWIESLIEQSNKIFIDFFLTEEEDKNILKKELDIILIKFNGRKSLYKEEKNDIFKFFLNQIIIDYWSIFYLLIKNQKKELKDYFDSINYSGVDKSNSNKKFNPDFFQNFNKNIQNDFLLKSKNNDLKISDFYNLFEELYNENL